MSIEGVTCTEEVFGELGSLLKLPHGPGWLLRSDKPLQWSSPVRALCYLVLKQYKEAVKDCTEALKLDGKNVKAFYRRAQAYKALKVKRSRAKVN